MARSGVRRVAARSRPCDGRENVCSVAFMREGSECFVERPVDDVELLLAGELDEVDGVAGHADRQLRVQLGMLHRVQQQVALQDVDVDVVPFLLEVAVEQVDEVARAFLRLAPERVRHDGEGEGDAVFARVVRQLRDGFHGGDAAFGVAPVHGVGARGEGLAGLAPVGGCPRHFPVHHVRGDGEDGERGLGVAVGALILSDSAQQSAAEADSPSEEWTKKFEETASMTESVPTVLYTGTLNRELGIGELLTAFETIKNCRLWLCGKGDMEQEAALAAEKHDNIHYFGFVSQQEALMLQKKADILINPRSGKGAFTRYSFPSKTLEYMRSGKPVVCYPLEGIPAEYADYLTYILREGADGIQQTIQSLLALTAEERHEIGMKAKEYALSEKNATVQCKRLMRFLRQNELSS